MTTNRDALDAQREHWQATFQANPDMYGTNPSQPGAYAAELFTQHHLHEMLELGAGQGRDTLAFLRAGLRVTALDYAPEALASLRQAATAAGLADRLITLVHDVRQPIPLPDASVDAVYSHMLFNMALSTAQLLTLAAEVRRVLRPGGLHVYTVRHTGDAHYGIGTDHGDGMFENGGFIVHFFDRPLVDRLAFGYTMLDLTTFEEGDLPRRLWRITLRRNQPTQAMPPEPSRRTILKPAKIAPSFNGMSAFSATMSGCPISQSVSHCSVGAADRIRVGQGIGQVLGASPVRASRCAGQGRPSRPSSRGVRRRRR